MERLLFLLLFILLGLFCWFFFIFIIWFIISMNRIRTAELKVKEADSGIDVALTKRYDVLTKQLATVKEYASYESKTLF